MIVPFVRRASRTAAEVEFPPSAAEEKGCRKKGAGADPGAFS